MPGRRYRRSKRRAQGAVAGLVPSVSRESAREAYPPDPPHRRETSRPLAGRWLWMSARNWLSGPLSKRLEGGPTLSCHFISKLGSCPWRSTLRGAASSSASSSSSASACVAILPAAGLSAGPWRGAPVGLPLRRGQRYRYRCRSRRGRRLRRCRVRLRRLPQRRGSQHRNPRCHQQARQRRAGPARRPAVPVHAAVCSGAGSLIVRPAGATFTYQFQVTPTLATHCHVEVFRNSGSTTPLATSPRTTGLRVHLLTNPDLQVLHLPGASLPVHDANRRLRPALSVG
jgi:hypothetical protein